LLFDFIAWLMLIRNAEHAQNSKDEGRTMQTRNVTAMQLQESMNSNQLQAFLRELKDCAQNSRPRIVIDCSKIRRMDQAVLLLLLSCLEEAMKRNGDVKLAALPPEAKAVFESTGAARLFKIFETVYEAIDSFRRPLAGWNSEPWASSRTLEAPADAA
jgi:anti-sigma B factor antagonist